MKTTTIIHWTALLGASFSLHAGAATFTASDVAKHATKNDCWIIIDGKVYDITTYIDDHPAPPRVLVEACGNDASKGWKTKGKMDKPHSRKATTLLRKYFKGEIRAGGG